MKIPVVCVHHGDAEYLNKTLAVSAMFGNDTHLIGDVERKGPFSFHHIDDYSDGIAELKKIFKHSGKHTPHFRYSATARWIIFRNFLRKMELPAFCIDGDVLVCCDIGREMYRIDSCDFTYSNDGSSGYAIGQSFWFNLAPMEALVDNIFEFYRGEVDANLHHPDMSHAREVVMSGKFRGENTYCMHGDGVLDHNIKMSQGRYTLVGHPYMKAITFKHGQPYCLDYIKKETVRFATLHCTYPAKSSIGRFYETIRKQLQG